MPQASHFQLQVSRCSLNASLLSKVDLHLTQLTNFALTEEAVGVVEVLVDVPLLELFVLLLLNKYSDISLGTNSKIFRCFNAKCVKTWSAVLDL